MKPLIFLDVDGVFNCPQAIVPYEHVHLGTAAEVFIPEGSAERLQRLLRVYEPVWATAWLGEAHECFQAPLRLSEAPWPHLNYQRFKILAIVKHAKARPWAWIDDDASYELEALNWFPYYDRFLEGFIIEPNPRVGLTDEHVDDLLTWTGDNEESRL
jgi:hypothetical protein